MEGNHYEVALREKQAPVQLSIWDLIEADPVTVPQPTDHTPAADAPSVEQQPAGDPVIAPVADLVGQAATTEVSITDSPADTSAPNASTDHPDQNPQPDAEPDPKPRGGSIPLQTGREAMTARAVPLYSAIGLFGGLAPTDLLTGGDPIFVDSKTVKELRSAYIAVDDKYRQEIEDLGKAATPVQLSREHRRAWDRARQKIDRAFDDLVNVYAADEVVDLETGKKTGYQIYRLPEVRRRQLDHGAEFAQKRPGGGRIMVDSAGSEVGRQHRIDHSIVQQPEFEIHQGAAERNDDA